MFIAILNHPDFDKYDMTSLRTGIMAEAPCPIETMNQVRTKMHCPEIVIAFGQTESAPVMTMTRRDDPIELRVSTVGRLLPDIEGKIIDPESGEDLSPDIQGEIVTRSACVMKGYYKMPEATAEAIDKDKWLHTGDLGEGEQVLAAIQLKAGQTASPEEFVEFCRGKIARHKIPKYREFVDGYPTTASGKIQKFKMKEIFSHKYYQK